MRCPRCQTDDDKVIDSRVIRDGIAIRRRRECIACNARFTTYEYIEPEELRVIKRDGAIENFSRDKLKKSIHIAFAKRPFNNEDIDKIVDFIEGQIVAIGPDVPSKAIGEIVMKELAAVDEVAYIRFASVYKRFHATGDFRDELEKLRPTKNQ